MPVGCVNVLPKRFQMIQYSALVEAPLAEVWAQFLIKIEQPQLFVPGVSKVHILDKKEALVVRQMTITTENTAIDIQEEITFAPYTVRFLILEHPLYEGYVDNIARAISETQTEITFAMHWKDKISQQPMGNLELLQNAVLKTKNHIEQHS